jgi:hypothetical protein
MAFNWFKKKKENEDDARYKYDPTDIKINKLRKGSFLDYDFKTWQVMAVYEYDWGDDFFADEFQIALPDKTTLYLYVEEDGDFYCTLNQKINVHDLGDEVVDGLTNQGKAPMRVQFEGNMYYRQAENVGYFRDAGNQNWTEMVSWSYSTKSEEKVLTIEQWGEEDFSASVGWVVKDYEFTNIIMP